MDKLTADGARKIAAAYKNLADVLQENGDTVQNVEHYAENSMNYLNRADQIDAENAAKATDNSPPVSEQVDVEE